MSLPQAVAAFLPRIESELGSIVDATSPDQASYYGMMRYHMGWTDDQLRPTLNAGGKRIRPLLCLLCCEAAGGDPRLALPAACGLELVHNFSLVHDDIQDRSPTRRGRKTVWNVWGTAHGINVGDGLFALARVAMHRLLERGVPPQRYASALLTLDRACLSLCEGQFLDMTFEARLDVTLREYLAMIGRKTAALFAASTCIGATLATDDPVLIQLYSGFGEKLGLAFQIQDDILGVWGDEQVTGKSAATDLRDMKKTLPVVYALDLMRTHPASEELAALYSGSRPLDEKGVQRALDALSLLGAREYAEAQAEAYYREALEDLRRTGIENSAQAGLRELAGSLLGRVV